jgi:radical SAM superfamily enzyme YgiQ (UPF0313 family)
MLINPFGLRTHTLPLGLAYLSSSLLENGFEVEIIDAGFFNHSANELKRKILNFSPDVVGISALSATYYPSIQIAKLVRDEAPEVKILMGGPHVTFDSIDPLKNGFCDVVVRGEGEKTITELCRSLVDSPQSLGKIRGISFKNGEHLCKTSARPLIQNLDSLPFPAWDLFPMEKYKATNPYAPVMSSRGCSYSCKYCSTSKMWRHKYRLRSIGNVVNELKVLRDQYGFTHISFIDDNFTFNKSRTLKLCEELKKLEMNWACGTRIDQVDKELLREMKKSGCRLIFFGIESGNQETLDFIRKNIRLNTVKKVIEQANLLEIQTIASFILGFPNETKEMAEKTVKYASRIKATYSQLHFLVPYPGTDFFIRMERHGIRFLTTTPWKTLYEIYRKRESSDWMINKTLIETRFMSAEDFHRLWMEFVINRLMEEEKANESAHLWSGCPR